MTPYTPEESAALLKETEGATEGEWGLTSEPLSVRSSHTEENNWRSEHIASMDHYREDREEQRMPNAALIAAAPRLIATVQARDARIAELTKWLSLTAGALDAINWDGIHPALRKNVDKALAGSKDVQP